MGDAPTRFIHLPEKGLGSHGESALGQKRVHTATDLGAGPFHLSKEARMNSTEVNFTMRCADGVARVRVTFTPGLSFEEVTDLDTAIKLRPHRWREMVDRFAKGRKVEIGQPLMRAA